MIPPTDGPTTTTVVLLVVVGLLTAVASYVWFAAAWASVLRKLGGERWRAWVPVLNLVEVLERGGQAGWQVLFLVVPVVDVYGFVLYVRAVHRIGRQFGRGAGTTVLGALLPPVWASVLGWSSAQPGLQEVPVSPRRVGTGAGVDRVLAGAFAGAVDAPDPTPARPVHTPPVVASAPAASPWAPVPVPAPPVPAQAPAPIPVAPAPRPVGLTAPAPAPDPVPAPTPAVSSESLPVSAPPSPPFRAPISVAPPGLLPVAPLEPLPVADPDPVPPVAAFVVAPQPVAVTPPPAVAHTVTPPPAVPNPAAPPDEEDDDLDGTVMVATATPEPWTLVLDDGRRLPLPGSSVLVGRRPPQTDPSVRVLAIADPGRTVSKVHARLELVDGAWLVTDLASTNGVHLVDPDGTERRLPPHVATPVPGRLVLGTLGMRLVPPGEVS